MTRLKSLFTTTTYTKALVYSKALVSIVLLVTLSACSSDIEVTTEFRNAQGLKEGTKVYYEDQGVGEVIDISEKDRGLLVTMAINKEAAETIDSQAAVVVNRIKLGGPLEIHASASTKSLGLKDGQQLHGLNSMIELVAWSVGDALQVGSGELVGYVDSFQDYLQGDKFQDDRARVEEGVKQMALVTSEALASVEKDLAEAMSDLDVTEEELAKAIELLGDELSPLAEEMAKSGTDLMAELEQFQQGLENGTALDHEAGERLISSLLATIEKLNDATERGVRRSEDEAD